MKAKNVNQIFKVPNTPQGRLFIELLKEYKSPCYNIVCKGRTINRKKCKKQKIGKNEIAYRQNVGNIPLALSDNIGVYITTKDGNYRVGASNETYHTDLRKRYYKLEETVNAMKEKFERIKEVVQV